MDLGERVAVCEEAINRLDGWNKSQNGHLAALDRKMDDLKDFVNNKVDRFQWLLVTTLIGCIITLIVK